MSSEIHKILDVCVNKKILIKLRNQTIIRGNLQTFDQHMNLVLTKAEDITEEKPKNLDRIILRGDNILIISLPEK
ncbi:putative snRNP Sm-like protein [Marine Group I thaumarchaeote SCGC RSA3]|uniref:Putative snRNP Sm-like protein n=2 Tax=Marine Group I TaxID=905826 RepID=A0A081RQG6_9ARCH|nr:Putative snRNP Sm-like protein [Marine Group I thaumarchaeote SCGC AAA799-N04]KFM20419.1 putative snRNP Sm-like protein [Marine Group I thaumarchaeote SCGC RSA3]